MPMYECPEGATWGKAERRARARSVWIRRREARRLSSALRSVAEIVDAALRDDHRNEYLARQLAEQLAQVKVDRKSEPRTDAARISTAMGVGANVIVTPYVASEMS
jgi:hypothetical protein